LRQGSVAVCVGGVVIVGISLRGHYRSMYVCLLKRGGIVPLCRMSGFHAIPVVSRARGLLFSSIAARDQIAKTHYECQEPQEYCQ